jgi:threonine aldolase
MDRRTFLATGGLTAAAPLLAQVSAMAPVAGAPGPDRVDLTSDGLALTPAEYAALLQQASRSRPIVADYYSNGDIVAEIEQWFAERLGKEAALFLPTGTLANHMAVRKLAGNDRRVLVQAESHLYNDSGDGASILSGLNLVPLAPGRSTVALAEVREWVERSESGRVPNRVGVISIENPVRRRNHDMVDRAELERVCDHARSRGIRLHLDGARMFNLPQHSGLPLREHARLFDTVYVSLWKHFNAASGAILAGSAAFIDGLLHERRMFGGSLPHAWPQLALVPSFASTYENDYANAWRRAEALLALLGASGRFGIDRVDNGTSLLFLSVRGAAAGRVVERARERGVILAAAGDEALRMQVNPTLLRRSPEAVAEVLLESANA